MTQPPLQALSILVRAVQEAGLAIRRGEGMDLSELDRQVDATCAQLGTLPEAERPQAAGGLQELLSALDELAEALRQQQQAQTDNAAIRATAASAYQGRDKP